MMHSMNIVPITAELPPVTKTRGKLTQQQRFLREWKRVQALQAQNLQLQQEVAQFATAVIPRIAPAELAFAQSNYHLAQKLLSFAGRKSLSRWQRAQLLHWIAQILEQLSDQPFAAGLDVEALYCQLECLEPPADGRDARLDDTQHEHAAIDEPFEDDVRAGTHNHEQEPFRQPQARAIKELLRSSSINKMFRKIASAIHPDRERHPHGKLLRNTQMVELIRARDEQDIPAIFTLYQQCIGASPVDAITDDFEPVITLLRCQVERLRGDRKRVIHANPLHGALYQRFYHKSPAKVDRVVNAHVLGVQRDAQSLLRATRCITTLSRLKALLEERAACSELVQWR